MILHLSRQAEHCIHHWPPAVRGSVPGLNALVSLFTNGAAHALTMAVHVTQADLAADDHGWSVLQSLQFKLLEAAVQ
jgi:hypothetical protein